MTTVNARDGFEAVVIGLGESGYACARHLAGRGVRLAVMDTRAAPPNAGRFKAEWPEVPQYPGGLNADVLCAAGEIVISPGVDPRLAPIARAAAAGVPIIGEMTLFRRASNAPVVAITGSNGKSTVTTLVGRMIAADGRPVSVGGNLGRPALDLLDDAPPERTHVLELSSFQLETVDALNADAAAVLNVSADHLDRYECMDDYAAAKARIYSGAAAAVVNLDDERVRTMATPPSARRVGFTLGIPTNDADWCVIGQGDRAAVGRGDRAMFPVSAIRLPGRHGIANVLAACALADQFGVTPERMEEAVRGFSGLPHRMELVREHAGRRWINDSKGTNVGATIAAVQGLDAPVVLIAGGIAKDQNLAVLGSALAGRLRAAILLGRDAPQLAEALGEVCSVRSVSDMGEAVAAANSLARPGDTVLLSPACASFDMFSGYAARGEAFREAVEGLGDD